MLGLAQGYELYGWLEDTVTWKKGVEKQFYNDETNEVVMFGFTDIFRKRKE